MTCHLVFHLWGPLQSWGGEGAIGEVRNAGEHPSKSAIIGLLGAAFGYERGNPKLLELQTALHFAVQVMSPGRRFTDFHTVQSPQSESKKVWQTRYEEIRAKKLNTIVSRRDYITDAMYRVMLWPTSEASLDIATVAQALSNPHFGFYLGRRACPLGMPLAHRLIEAEDPVAALAQVMEAEEGTAAQKQLELVRDVADRLHVVGPEINGKAGNLFSDVPLQSSALQAARITRKRDKLLPLPRHFAVRNEYAYHLKATKED